MVKRSRGFLDLFQFLEIVEIVQIVEERINELLKSFVFRDYVNNVLNGLQQRLRIKLSGNFKLRHFHCIVINLGCFASAGSLLV